MTVDNITKARATKRLELEQYNNNESISENGLQPIYMRR